MEFKPGILLEYNFLIIIINGRVIDYVTEVDTHYKCSRNQVVVVAFVYSVSGLLEAHAPDISYDSSGSIFYTVANVIIYRTTVYFLVYYHLTSSSNRFSYVFSNYFLKT
jgi:uncharacterized membrane protein YesL